MENVFTLHKPVSPAPLFLDSPHSGVHYPADFGFSCAPHLLRQSEDMFLDKLIADMPRENIGTLTAHIARSYIDVNRARDDIDPALVTGRLPFTPRPTERSYAGHGLIRSVCRGQQVYTAPLPPETVLARIANVYDVYHAALSAALQELHTAHGRVFLINCHSMPSGIFKHLLPWGARKHTDIVLGDMGGNACDAYFVNQLAARFRAKGYSVAHNDPYRGVEIVQRWGRPREGFHAVQLEINRALYMDEENFVLLPRFAQLKADLENIFCAMRDEIIQDTAEERLAAE